MDFSHSSTVAFLGPEGSFSHEFALKHFGKDANFLPVEGGEFDPLIQKLTCGDAHYAVLPIYNSNGSHIERALKALSRVLGSVTVASCHPHEIVLNLIVNEEFQTLQIIKTKPEVYLQCKTWLNGYESVERLNRESTSAALKEVTEAKGEERKWVGAIGNVFAMDYYGGKVWAAGIEDRPNFTLFAVISSGAVDNGASQVLICLTCPEQKSYDRALADFLSAGYKFVHGTLKGAFSPGVPLWIEFSRTSESRPLLPLIKASADRHFLGSFSFEDSISRFIAQLFN